MKFCIPFIKPDQYESMRNEIIRNDFPTGDVADERIWSITIRRTKVKGYPDHDKLTVGEYLPARYQMGRKPVLLLLRSEDRLYVYTLGSDGSGVKLVRYEMFGAKSPLELVFFDSEKARCPQPCSVLREDWPDCVCQSRIDQNGGSVANSDMDARYGRCSEDVLRRDIES